MKRLITSLGCISLVVSLSGVTAVATVSTPEEGEAFWIALGTITPPGECAAACHFNSCNMVDEHSSSSVNPGTQEVDDGAGHPCVDAGLCEYAGGTAHPDCFETAPEPEAEALVLQATEILDTAVANHDGATIARLIEAAPRVFYLNAGRQAVQVLGCSQQVAAHYPISPRMMDQLLESTE